MSSVYGNLISHKCFLKRNIFTKWWAVKRKQRAFKVGFLFLECKTVKPLIYISLLLIAGDVLFMVYVIHVNHQSRKNELWQYFVSNVSLPMLNFGLCSVHAKDNTILSIVSLVLCK